MLKVKALLSKILNWSGFAFDWSEYETNNTTDTWIPVLREKKVQHRVIPAGTPFVYKGYASGDFNDLQTEGIHYTKNSMTANKPSGSTSYGFIVVLNNGAMVTQLYFDTNGKVFTRVYSGDPRTWKNWTAL